MLSYQHYKLIFAAKGFVSTECPQSCKLMFVCVLSLSFLLN